MIRVFNLVVFVGTLLSRAARSILQPYTCMGCVAPRSHFLGADVARQRPAHAVSFGCRHMLWLWGRASSVVAGGSGTHCKAMTDAGQDAAYGSCVQYQAELLGCAAYDSHVHTPC